MCWIKKFKIRRLQKQLRNMQLNRQQNQSNSSMLRKEVQLYHKFAKIYEKLEGHKKFPFAKIQALACYRAAAALNNSESQFILGEILLEEAKLREVLQSSEVFASTSNDFFLQETYKEAHAFLLAAEKQQHIKAKRIRGLCYINGWGVEVDKDMGFDLVVASIEQENSWDRVQKIFKEIGINESSFFSELFQHRK